jgi:hypothetical protein
MNPVLLRFVIEVARKCDELLNHYGDYTRINTLWNGTPNYDDLITQAVIDLEPQLVEAGITRAQLADAIAAIVNVKTAVDNALPSLTLLATLVGR